MARCTKEKEIVVRESRGSRALSVLLAFAIRHASRVPHVIVAFLLLSTSAHAIELDQMSIDRWKVLRETERYQLNIAERYYKEKNWKVALGEYEKYLTLYETSEAAPYAQLKWSICQLNLRKANTAIKEGFQSVIDYWPDSADATSASYFIANSYKTIGQISKAKKAYRDVLKKHPEHLVAIRSMVDLIDITTIEKDEEARVQLWKKLAFDIKRNDRATQRICSSAASSYASYCFNGAAFTEGLKALSTNYAEDQLSPQAVYDHVRRPIQNLTGANETKLKGDQLTKQAVAWIREHTPSDLSDEANKNTARQMWYYIADLHAAARHEAEIPKIYEQINKIFGIEDETLGRFASWYKYYKKDYDKARGVYRQFKDKVAGLNQVAYSYREQRKIDDAVSTYNQVLGIDTENTVRWKSEIGATYRGVGRYEEAIGVYRELLSLDAVNANNWRWQIATAYHESKKYKEAIGNYLNCTNEPSNYMQIALCNRALKQYGEALLYYNQVLSNHPGSAPEALYQIARTHEEAKKKESAIKAFQQVCKRFPKTRQASTAHAHLQNVYKISVTLGGAADK